MRTLIGAGGPTRFRRLFLKTVDVGRGSRMIVISTVVKL